MEIEAKPIKVSNLDDNDTIDAKQTNTVVNYPNFYPFSSSLLLLVVCTVCLVLT